MKLFKFNENINDIIINTFKKRNNENFILKLLKQFEFNVNLTDEYNDNLLILSIQKNYNKVSKILIDKGININHIGWYGDTALIVACCDYYTQKNIIYLLLDKNADVTIKNSNNEMAFDFLSKGEQVELKNKYPEQYRKYIIEKDMKKYNI